MLKTYKAKTVISTNLLIGKSVMHIRFIPHSYGGSVYTTGDKNIQEALESSKQFGVSYELEDFGKGTMDEGQGSGNGLRTTDNGQRTTDDGQVTKDNGQGTNELQEVEVSDIEEARDYLEQKYAIRRSTIRRKGILIEVAAKYGIKFVGI